MTDNICADRGTLAEVRRAIPTDPHTFAYRGIDRVIPCSHVACGSCGARVKTLDGQRVAGDLAKAYDVDAPSTEGTDADWRFYFCRCSHYLCQMSVSLHLAGNPEYQLDLPESWSCGGHPVRSLPTSISGVEIPADPKWRAIVARSFRAEAPEGDPHFWARWLPEVYGQLSGTPHPKAINSVIADLMVSTDAVLRAGALYFLWDSLEVPAVDLLPDMFLEDAESLRGQRDPRGNTDLCDLTARVLAYHVRRGRFPMEGTLRNTLRMQLMQPGSAGGLALLFSEQDPDWLLEHFELLVERSPDAADSLAKYRDEVQQRRSLLGL